MQPYKLTTLLYLKNFFRADLYSISENLAPGHK
ncbi:Uncharacterised protein [Providencia stuartii]|nr:Uncharacterised protein [Providencia stuartii]SUC78626.1 Uncharacterised protein [Providencia stuartii]